jgi:predicted nucleic acid-binding protein
VITFFDASVLVSTCLRTHVHHSLSLDAFAAADKTTAACGAHTLAEIYAVTTSMPAPYRVAPDDAWLFLRQVSDLCSLISLDAHEYLDTLETIVERERAGGIIYDALLLACARKAKADRILTWNVKHFRLVAPDLADRIVTP